MARVFSWKIAPNKYAYIVPEESGNYIRNEISSKEVLGSIAEEVAGMSLGAYTSAFNAIVTEAAKYGVTFKETASFYYGEGTNGATVALLSGQDGSGSGGNLLNEDDYNALAKAIDDIFSKYKEEIAAQIAAIKGHIEDAVSSDVADATGRLADANEELNRVREELEEMRDAADDALEKAREAIKNGEVTPEIIEDILKTIDPVGEWFEQKNFDILEFKKDYDAARGLMGGIASGEDVADGILSTICSNINVISGTVGTVENTMAAVSGLCEQVATWYSESANSMTVASSTINASKAYIEDLVKYIDGDKTNMVYNRISGDIALIESKTESKTNEKLTVINQQLSALSGKVKTTLDNLDFDSGTINSIKNEMNVLAGNITQSLTQVQNGLNKTTKDLREEWSIQSGMLRTVSNMVVEKDEDGEPIFWYKPGGTTDESQWIRVYATDDPLIYTDRNSHSYSHDVYPQYSVTMASFIQQTASAITMGISQGGSDDGIFQLRYDDYDGDGRDEPIIYAQVSKAIFDADLIAKSLTANEANIGGVHIGKGHIYANNTNNGGGRWELDSGGTLSATNAQISGNITATTLTLGGGKTIETYVSDAVAAAEVGITEEELQSLINNSVSSTTLQILEGTDYIIVNDKLSNEASGTSFVVSRDGLLTANNAVIRGTVFASEGQIGGFSIKDKMLYTNTSIEDGQVGVILNSSDAMSSSTYGKLVIAAGRGGGFVSRVVMHKWTNSNHPQFSTIYTTVRYSTGLGHTNGIQPTVYIKKNDGTFEQIDSSPFRFVKGNTTYNSQSAETDCIRYTVMAGNGTFGSPNFLEEEESTILGVEEVVEEELCASVYTSSILGAVVPPPGYQFDVALCQGDGDYEEWCADSSIILPTTGSSNIETAVTISTVSYDFIYAGSETINNASDSLANTKIYEDGTIITDRLFASEGQFNGEIDSGGIFNGKLNGATGSLNQIVINGGNFNGNITLTGGDSIRAYTGARSESGNSSELFFSINNSKISTGTSNSLLAVEPYSFEKKNHNGSNNGQDYIDIKKLLNFSTSKGGTVTVPSSTTEISIYCPTGNKKQLTPSQYPSFSLTIEKNNGAVIETILQGKLTSPAKNGRWYTWNVVTNEKVYTNLESGIFYNLVLRINYHLPTYSLLGTDVAYCGVKFKMGGKVKINYNNEQEGFFIGTNGFKYVSNHTKVSAINDEILLQCGNYSLKITDSGFSVNGGSTQSTL